jgi:hypothetical protein
MKGQGGYFGIWHAASGDGLRLANAPNILPADEARYHTPPIPNRVSLDLRCILSAIRPVGRLRGRRAGRGILTRRRGGGVVRATDEAGSPGGLSAFVSAGE